MSAGELRVQWGAENLPLAANGETVSAIDLKAWLIQDRVWPHLFRYDEVELLTNRWENMPRPWLGSCAAWALARRRAAVIDGTGRRVPVTLGLLARLTIGFARDVATRPAMLGRVRRDLDRLEKPRATMPSLDLVAPPLYLRTDLVFGLRSGGSVGHIAGVLNQLEELCGPPVFVTTDRIPTVRDDIETHLIPTLPRYRDLPEAPLLFSNRAGIDAARGAMAGRPNSFVYQRYSLMNYAGLAFSRERSLPFVLEYNGSEVWIAKHWGGSRLRHQELAERIEMANLRAADLIVVVSRPMRDELIERGIDGDAILVNPNGVDPEVYSPAVDGSAVRRRLGLDGKTVIGFIGTFGPWHGAEVLVDAVGRLISSHPEYRDRVRLLLIGDGVRMPHVKDRLARNDITRQCVLAGRVAQTDGPAHLAACDLFASPHVPNQDGTPFFGSPTKLFEYMAMGRAIVASDLDQIGEVLRHDRTAWLVPPGDPEALATGLARLLDDPALRDRLGHAARAEAVAHHTWREHTRRIVGALARRGNRND